MKKRIVSLMLALVLVVGAIGTLGITTGAESTAPDLTIAQKNISFRDAIAIKFAVAACDYDVKLLTWTSAQTEYTVDNAEKVITNYNTVDLPGYMVFDYTGVSAKQMTDVIYARAYAEVDGVDTYGDVINYSVLTYAYSKLGKLTTGDPTENANLIALLEDVLAYGASAQTYFDYAADRLATADWNEVTVEGGKLADGTTGGLYFAGDTVTLIAPETNEEGFVFSHWEGCAGTKYGTTATYELTVSGADVYTAMYKDPNAAPEIPALPEWPADSVGLEVEDDGEFGYVLSIGDCTDTTVVIPATVNGFEVIEIDGFDGTEIEAIYLPNTSELTIVRNAFADSTLTDVYYNGTAAEWEEKVSIKTGNGPITNATMHFIPYLVTFVDYDGKVLAYEYVEAGESATAPNPTREGYIFTGWSADITAVNSDLTVTAQYQYDTEDPTVILSDVVVAAGETAEVTVSVLNNPGIAVANMTVYYNGTRLDFNADDVNATNGAIFPTLDSGLNLFFSADANCTGDDVLATVSFTVAEGTAAGTYPITITINEIIDENAAPVEFAVVAGSIIVK